jgi:hypothetical protein
MSTKLTSLVTAHYILLARSFVVILGGIAIWWGIVGFPVFWQGSSTERIAGRIIAGDPFKVEVLGRQLPIINSIETSAYCRPAALRSAAIIQLRMVEAATSANNGKHVDEQLKSLGNMIRSSLSCAPADPFLWLVLYWVESTENGSKADYLKYLRMSYLLGPSEGWIALKRNRLLFRIFEYLPPDLAEHAVSEFTALLRTYLIGEVADILTGPAWRVRDIILPHLLDVPEQQRRAFREFLYNKGYDLSVPGVDRRSGRPWN